MIIVDSEEEVERIKKLLWESRDTSLIDKVVTKQFVDKVKMAQKEIRLAVYQKAREENQGISLRKSIADALDLGCYPVEILREIAQFASLDGAVELQKAFDQVPLPRSNSPEDLKTYQNKLQQAAREVSKPVQSPASLISERGLFSGERSEDVNDAEKATVLENS